MCTAPRRSWPDNARIAESSPRAHVSEQSLYNVTARTVELEVIPALRHHGVGLIPWSPLGGGLLGGALRKAQGEGGRRATPQAVARIEQYRPQLEAYEALCAELGEQPADVGLAWLLHNPVVPSAIVDPPTVEQLATSRRALEMTLPREAFRRLDEIWPGPGEAPEAYAW